MGRTRLLTVFQAAITAGQFRTYSWGPFRGTLRIRHFWFRHGDVTATRTSAGLFIATTKDRPSGVFSASFTGFPGWTAVHDAADFDAGNSDDSVSVFLPFQAPSADGYIIGRGGWLDVTSDLFYLKLLVRNQTGAGIPLHAHLVVEENPADADDGVVVPRPIPGAPPPAPPPPAPPPPAPPPPTPAPPTLPPAPDSTLPPPDGTNVPPITLDPVDVDASIREFIQA